MRLTIKGKRFFIVFLFLIGIFASLVITTFVGQTNAEFFMIPAWTIAYTVTIAAVFRKLELSRFVSCAAMVSWVARIILVPIDYYTGIARQPDQFGFLEEARQLVSGEVEEVVHSIGDVYAGEYHVFGISPIMVKMTNAFICMLGVAIAIHCLKRLDIRRRLYDILSAVLLLSPMTILLSVTALRESIYYATVAASLYFFIEWTEEGRLKDFIKTILVLLPDVFLHGGMAFFVLAYLIVFFFSQNGKKSYRYLIKVSFIVVGLLSVPILARIEYFGAFFSESGAINALIGYVESSNGANALAGNSSYLEWTVGMISPIQIVLYTPLRMVYFLLSPMIWNVKSILDMLMLVTDSSVFIAWGCALARIVKRRNVRNWMKHSDKGKWLVFKGCMMVVLIISIAYGWGTITTGTALRHRNCLIPFVCVIMAIVMDGLGDTNEREIGQRV